MVNCYRNTLGGGGGMVGYLTPIVRYHIKPAHPKRHPTKGGPHQLQWGRVYYSGSSPLHSERYVIDTCILSIGLELILVMCSSAL